MALKNNAMLPGRKVWGVFTLNAQSETVVEEFEDEGEARNFAGAHVTNECGTFAHLFEMKYRDSYDQEKTVFARLRHKNTN